VKIRFFNIWMDLCTADEILQAVKSLKDFHECRTLFFINAHCFNLAQNDEEYRNIISQSDIVLNDGVGMDIAAKIEGFKFKENLNGTDLIPQIIRIAAEERLNIYLLGGGKDVAKTAREKIKRIFPTVNIVGYSHGYFNSEEEEQLIQDINSKNTDIILVGMGVPLQEKWIRKNKNRFTTAKLCIAGGAILDFISGRVRRAPVIAQKLKIEWFFRLMLEPRRLFKRYVIGNFVFLMHALKFKLFPDYKKPEFKPEDVIQNILEGIKYSKSRERVEDKITSYSE